MITTRKPSVAVFLILIKLTTYKIYLNIFVLLNLYLNEYNSFCLVIKKSLTKTTEPLPSSQFVKRRLCPRFVNVCFQNYSYKRTEKIVVVCYCAFVFDFHQSFVFTSRNKKQNRESKNSLWTIVCATIKFANCFAWLYFSLYCPFLFPPRWPINFFLLAAYYGQLNCTKTKVKNKVK